MQGAFPDGYANPEGTSPGPAPLGTVRPVGYWESPAVSLAFVGSATGRTALWGTTLFDLRTDLRGAENRELVGTPLNRGSAAQLFISIAGLSNNHLGMRLFMCQWGHAVDGLKAAQFLPWTNVTADIATGTDLAILDYFPPGSGYQMRYWKVQLRFQFGTQVVPARLPTIQVQAGAY